jgi:type II secretion system protein J
MQLPFKKMTNDQCRMENAVHSTLVIRHSKISFADHSAHGKTSSAAIGRRSPGRKALFSSIHPAPASWTASAGFTLIEVLLALMVCAVVLVIVGSFLAGALQVQEHVNANLDRSMPIERALGVLRKDLKNAVAPGGMLAGPMQSGSEQGGVGATDGVQIYTTTGLITPNAPWGEIQRVTYGLQASGDASDSGGKDLVRTITRNLLTTGTEDDDQQFLASGIESLNFSYFDGNNWLDTWDDTTETNLPVAVRVNVQMAAASQNATRPDPIQLLVPLMVQVNTNQLDNTDDGSSTNSTTGGGP